MNYSENYNFALPEDNDGYDISPLSENFETLDGILAENETTLGEVSAKIGSPSDTGKSTVFGCLNSSGNSLIKSIHTVRIETTANATPITKALNTTINPNRCIVITDRLYDKCLNHHGGVDYTLNENSITASVKHPNGNYEVTLLFQIIEFC